MYFNDDISTKTFNLIPLRRGRLRVFHYIDNNIDYLRLTQFGNIAPKFSEYASRPFFESLKDKDEISQKKSGRLEYLGKKRIIKQH